MTTKTTAEIVKEAFAPLIEAQGILGSIKEDIRACREDCKKALEIIKENKSPATK
jgi:hypothetical protein